MFREEYRKANDAVHAPEALKEAIRGELSEETSFAESFSTRKRIWPRVLGYSGAAVAAAALLLLVVRPFAGRENNKAEAQVAEMAASARRVEDTAYAAEEISEEMSAATEDSARVAAVPNMAAAKDTDDYFDPIDAGIELTYADVWEALAPVGADRSEESGAETKAASGGSDALLPPGRIYCGEETLGDRRFVLSEQDGKTYVTVFDGDGQLLGEGTADGRHLSHECRDTQFVEVDLGVTTHPAVIVTTQYVPALSEANEADPASFCPTVSDRDGARVLVPDEISLLEVGDCYTVYAAFGWDEGVRVLYVYAELSADGA